ncbi:hypothetical protein HPB50_004459 [Hyalomma asiaticum]|uniref:Uncharacterized protein n=1 Tax=Hyalomma asiaticum TaxID=266040 RepID=A0ACB7TEE0_HYAAI|nr:hypothetical protein HPB50_004459 [Hyalomma asiaticum]
MTAHAWFPHPEQLQGHETGPKRQPPCETGARPTAFVAYASVDAQSFVLHIADARNAEASPSGSESARERAPFEDLASAEALTRLDGENRRGSARGAIAILVPPCLPSLSAAAFPWAAGGAGLSLSSSQYVPREYQKPTRREVLRARSGPL